MTYNNIEQKAINVDNTIKQWKTEIAAAITDKGVQTSATDNKATFISNINNISGGGSLEPGSTIPADLLEPPSEKVYIKGATNNSIEFSFRYENKIIYTDSSFSSTYNSLSVFDIESNTSKIFPNTSMYDVYTCGVKIEENIIACEYYRSSGSYDHYFVLINLAEEIIIRKVSLNITGTDGSNLNSYGNVCMNIVKVGEEYFLLYGNYSSSKNILIKIAADDTVTILKMNTIDGTTDTYYYNMITDGEKLFILSSGRMFSVSTDLQLINQSNARIKGNSSYPMSYTMLLVGDNIFVKPTGSFVFSVNKETLEYANVETYVASSSHYFVQLDDDLIVMYSGSTSTTTEGKTVTFYNKNLEMLHSYVDEKSSMASIGIFQENTTKYIIMEAKDGRIIKINAANFDKIWDVVYSTYINASGYESNCMIDFYNKQHICHLYDDKIYLVRNGITSIDNEPKYTIKAQTLESYPEILSFLEKTLLL